MKVQMLFFTALLALLLGCEDGFQMPDSQLDGSMSALSISVLNANSNTKALIEDDYLPNASEIGVTVLNSSGGAYDGIDYKNIRFAATGTGATQTWAGDEKVYLSATEGVCYGYYPYSSTATDITQIPVSTSGQVDYMYANPEPVDIASRNATLDMNHVLSAVRFALKLGTYTGTGAVTDVSVTGSNIGTSATLNATNGELSSVTGTGTAISVNKSLTLSNEAKNVDVIVIPTKTEAALTLSVTIDGKVYSTTTTAVTLQQGKCHTYTMTINAGELSLSSVKVGDWGYDDSGTPTIDAAGYKVTFKGDISGIAFSNSVRGSSVIIEAYAKYDYYQPNEVTKSGTATMMQSVSGRLRKIKLSDITSDIIVTFAGASDNRWKGLADGVYVVKADGSPGSVDAATSDCIGVALINSDTGQKLMIEKHENANSSYQQSFVESGATGTSYRNFYWGYYGKSMNNLLGISDYPSYTEASSAYPYGYVPDKDGNYSVSSNFLGLPSTWPTDATKYALADRAGKQHSEYLMQVTQNDGYTEYPKMGQLLKTFLSSNDALGYDDWYIPACGQLALFYVFMSDINVALTAIGGTTLNAHSYLSSSEYNDVGGWAVGLDFGTVSYYGKGSNTRLRLVRNL